MHFDEGVEPCGVPREGTAPHQMFHLKLKWCSTFALAPWLTI